MRVDAPAPTALGDDGRRPGALVLDLDLVDVPWLVFLEEALELSAAVALVFGSVSVAGERSLAGRNGEVH